MHFYFRTHILLNTRRYVIQTFVPTPITISIVILYTPAFRFKCELCSFSTNTDMTYKQHLREHDKKMMQGPRKGGLLNDAIKKPFFLFSFFKIDFKKNFFQFYFFILFIFILLFYLFLFCYFIFLNFKI